MAKIQTIDDYQPLQKAREKKEQIEDAIYSLNQKLTTAASGRISQTTIDDLETQVLIEKASEADLNTLKAANKQIDHEESEIRHELQSAQRQLSLINAGITEREAEAKAIVISEWEKVYKPAVKRLSETFTAAIEANAEVIRIYLEGREATLPLNNDGKFALPICGMGTLDIRPDPVHGDRSAKIMLDGINAYLKA